MEESLKSETSIKSKISFSVESLLSHKGSSPQPPERLSENYEEIHQRLKHDDDEDEEDITVDDDDNDEVASRESLSPNSGHNIIVPQPLHPSMSRMVTTQGPPQWSFPWPGHAALLRSSSPQSKLNKTNTLLFTNTSNVIRYDVIKQMSILKF